MLRLGYALIDSTSAILTYRLVARIIYIDSQWYPRELASRCDLRFLVAPLEKRTSKEFSFFVSRRETLCVATDYISQYTVLRVLIMQAPETYNHGIYASLRLRTDRFNISNTHI